METLLNIIGLLILSLGLPPLINLIINAFVHVYRVGRDGEMDSKRRPE